MDTTRLGPFLGMDNRRPDTKLVTADGSYLRNAVNVDLGVDGSPKRRPGVTKVLSADDCHSFYGCGDHGYFAAYATLYHVDAAYAATALLTDLTPGVRLSYTQTPLGTVAADGSRLWLLNGTLAEPFTLDVPRLAPLLEATAGGALPAGRYQVALASTRAGQVSGTTVPEVVDVPANGVLTLYGLPASDCAVYLTPPDGEVFFHVADTTSSTLTFSTLPDYGGQCPTLLQRPMPSGSLVRHHKGRLLTASGSTLYYSEPFAPALHDPLRGYIAFPAPITLVEPCQNGVYIAADQTYWIAGDIADAELNPVLPYGAVLGASGEVPNSNSVWWMSERGLVTGTQDGQVQNLQEKNVVVDKATVGAALFREQDGAKQMIAALFNTTQTVAAARTFMDAEIVRRGETL